MACCRYLGNNGIHEITERQHWLNSRLNIDMDEAPKQILLALAA